MMHLLQDMDFDIAAAAAGSCSLLSAFKDSLRSSILNPDSGSVSPTLKPGQESLILGSNGQWTMYFYLDSQDLGSGGFEIMGGVESLSKKKKKKKLLPEEGPNCVKVGMMDETVLVEAADSVVGKVSWNNWKRSQNRGGASESEAKKKRPRNWWWKGEDPRSRRKKKYSRGEMESMRFANSLGQGKMWTSVYDGLGACAAEEYESLCCSTNQRTNHPNCKRPSFGYRPKTTSGLPTPTPTVVLGADAGAAAARQNRCNV